MVVVVTVPQASPADRTTVAVVDAAKAAVRRTRTDFIVVWGWMVDEVEVKKVKVRDGWMGRSDLVVEGLLPVLIA